LRRLVVDHADPELRHQHDTVAPPGQRAPEQALACVLAVDVGRVEQRDARVERRIDDRTRARFVDAPAEVVALRNFVERSGDREQ
jgi:hypothetical protein